MLTRCLLRYRGSASRSLNGLNVDNLPSVFGSLANFSTARVSTEIDKQMEPARKYLYALRSALRIQDRDRQLDRIVRVLSESRSRSQGYSLFAEMKQLKEFDAREMKLLIERTVSALIVRWHGKRDYRAMAMSILMELLFADIRLFKTMFKKLYYETWRESERGLLRDSDPLFDAVLQSKSTKKGFRIRMCARLFDIAIDRGMPLVAASMVIFATDNSTRIGVERILKLFHSLLVWDPNCGFVKMAALSRVYNAYYRRWGGTLPLPAEMKAMIVNTGLELSHGSYPSFANDCMDLAMRMQGDPVPAYVAYELMTVNLRFGNPARAMELWRYVRQHYSRDMQLNQVHVPDILHLLSQYEGYEQSVDKIIECLPLREFSTNGISEALLRHAARTHNVQLAHRVYKVLSHPLRSSVLSASLELHCEMGDTEGVRKIVDEINRRGGMTVEDSVVIVRSMAERDVQSAAQAIERMDWPAHGRFLQYEQLARASVKAGEHELFEKYLGRMHELLDANVHAQLDSLSMDNSQYGVLRTKRAKTARESRWSQHLLTFINLRLDYIAVSQANISLAQKLWQTRFALVDVYSPSARLTGLVSILRGALLQRSVGTFAWLYQELLTLGLSANDIIGMTFKQMRASSTKLEPAEVERLINLATSLERSMPPLLHSVDI